MPKSAEMRLALNWTCPNVLFSTECISLFRLSKFHITIFLKLCHVMTVQNYITFASFIHQLLLQFISTSQPSRAGIESLHNLVESSSSSGLFHAIEIASKSIQPGKSSESSQFLVLLLQHLAHPFGSESSFSPSPVSFPLRTCDTWNAK